MNRSAAGSARKFPGVEARWNVARHGLRTKIAAFLLFLATLVLLSWTDGRAADVARAGLPELVPTAYAAPDGAVFVAPDGSDDAAGTERRPLRTVAAAVLRAPAGGTVVLRRGTYREALPALSKPITLQPFANEPAWLKGSRVVRRWRRDGAAWVHDGWDHAFCDGCHHPDNMDPARPHAGLPDQVFVDEIPLRQVARREEVVQGTFAVDRKNRRLWLGTDPTDRTVEASIHGTALTVGRGAQGTRIRGLGFAQYAPTAEPGLGGMVRGDAPNLLFERNVFASSAVKGLSVFAPDVTVRGNVFLRNGMMGLEAWRADRLVVRDNRFVANNSEGFVQTGEVSEAAGAKITASRDVVVSDNVFERNDATGLWLDIDVIGATVVRNVMRDNARHGLHFEISARALIASNVFVGNDVSGVALADAVRARVLNNTFVANPVALLVQDDRRDQPDADMERAGNTWSSGRHVFANNVVVGGMLSWVRDFTGRLGPAEMLPASDRNAYARDPATPTAEWWTGDRKAMFESLADYREATGLERESLGLDAALAPATGSWALPPDSPARGAGLDLPSDVATAIGVAPAAPDMGALLGPGGAPVTRR